MNSFNLRQRSQSVSSCHKYGSKGGFDTKVDEINDLKSFQPVWEKIKRREKGTDKNKGPKSSSAVEKFVFPFFHLDSSDFVSDGSCFWWGDQQILFSTFWETSSDFPLNRLLGLTGLDEVKREFLSARDKVQAARIYPGRDSIRALNLDLIISGNPGTGKTTVAKLYAEYLGFLGVVSSCRWTSNYGSYYTNSCYGNSCEEDVKNEAIIMDEHIDTDLLHSDQNVLIVVGPREQVKDIFSHSKARGRFSRWIDIKDYSDDELLTALISILKRDFLKVDGGFGAPFLRTFTSLIGHQRGQKSFENIRTLQKEALKIRQRHAERLGETAWGGSEMIASIPYKLYDLAESDFFGVNPAEFYNTSKAWKKLEKMVGLETVKEAVKGLAHRRILNYAREIQGKEPLKVSCNYVFLGPPGTGKTTVAALFGQIIADLGYIETREVAIKRPTDFIGPYVGHSEERTATILEETQHQVLIIDEAHMFYHGSEHGTDDSDVFRKSIVDTIVAHVDNEPGNNRCIILMGYPDRMKEFYRNTNPGFQRRFPLEDAFIFDNYNDQELSQIFDIMLAKDCIMVTNNAKTVAMEILRRERDRPNFGNGGAVRNLISRAQLRHNKRIHSLATANKVLDADTSLGSDERSQVILEPQDFDPDHDRGLIKDEFSLLKNMVGFEDVIKVFEGYQTMAINMRRRGLDPREEIPFGFIFKGPPGTGKTTTARALGNIYHSMGFLSTTEVLDCSVTGLIGPGPCMTGKNVQNLLDRALGKVLFIDEAYRLAQTDLTGAVISTFAIEALGELVDCMTKERYSHKLVIVLAGYEKYMDNLMATNEGLRSRFKEVIFPNMKPKVCLRLLHEKLAHKKIQILQPSRVTVMQEAIRLFERLSKTEAWANARDVETISKQVIRRVFTKEILGIEELEISLDEIVRILKIFLQERRSQRQTHTSSDECSLPCLS